jgi:hypothetical protein
MVLEIEDKSFRLPIGDRSWSNDAIVEVEFAAAAPAPAQVAPATAP